MAKAINQNDIIEIIKTKIEFLNSITDVVLAGLNNTNIAKVAEINYGQLFYALNKIFGEDGIVFQIITKNNQLTKLKIKPMNPDAIINVFNNIFKILIEIRKFSLRKLKKINQRLDVIENSLRKIVNISESLKNIKIDNNAIKSIDNVRVVINKIISIFTNVIISALLAPFAMIAMIVLTVALLAFIPLFNAMSFVSKFIVVISFVAFNSFKRSIKAIKLIFANIIIAALLAPFAMIAMIVLTVALLAFIPLFTIMTMVSKFIVVISFAAFNSFKRSIKAIKLIFANIIIAALLAPFAVIAMIIVTIALLTFIPIILVLRLISKLISKSSIAIKRLSIIFTCLIFIFLQIILLGVLSILAIVAIIPTVVFMGMLIGLIFMIKLVGKLASKIPLKSILGLIMLSVVLMLMLIIAGEVFLISLMASSIVENAGDIFISLAIIAGVAAAAVGLGFLGMSIAPIIGLAMVGLGMIMFTVGMIFVLALMLLVIQSLSLDPNIIKEKVRTVIDTALLVIELLFETDASKDDEGGEKGWFDSVLSFLGKGFIMIIKAILAIAFLALSIVTILLVLFLATELNLLQKIDLQPGVIKQNVATVIDTALMVISSLFDREKQTDNETDKSWIESVLSFLGKGFIMIMQAIIAIAFLALSIVTILLILFLADKLSSLQKIDLKPELVKKNVATVIETAKSVIATLFQKDEEGDKDSNKDWIRDVIEFLGIDKLKFIVDAIMAIGLLALMVVSVLLLVELAKNLEYIQGVNLNDTDVISKTNTIINTANLVVKEMTKPDTTKEHKDEKGILSGILDALIPDDLEKMLDALKVIGRVGMQFACIYLLKTLAENLVTIKEFPDMVGITEKVSTITSTADELIKKILGNEGEKLDFNKSKDRLNTLDRVLTIFKNFSNYTDVGNAEKLTNNYIRFMDKIDTVDLEKLQTTERLFKNMAEFSESISGNFDKLADALNEKIAPLLEKLDKGIQDLNNDVNNNSKKQLQATAESNLADASSDTLKNAAGEDKDKLDKLTTQQKAAQDKDKKKYQGMQDIMDILLGQGGYKGVKITSK